MRETNTVTTRYNAILADDHLASTSAFATVLARTLPLDVLSLHAHAGSAVAQVQAHARDDSLPPIHLVLLDIEMPGLDPFLAVKRIKQAMPRVRVAFRSGFPTDAYIDRSIATGADGFITKGEDLTSTEYALRAILAGETYFSPCVSDRLVHNRGTRVSRLATLSERELEALRHFASGLEKDEIAEQMGLTTRSVANYLSRVSDKLDIRGAVGLVRFAFNEGLITL